MIKRLLTAALAAVMVISAGVTAAFAAEVDDAAVGADSNISAGADTSSAVTGDGDKIYFDASPWKNYTLIYAHIWERGGDDFFPWQSKKEACRKVSDNLFEYDLSMLDKSSVTGGIKADKDYCVIFSANNGMQTYDTTFGRACIGDTVKVVSGSKIENPKDSEKQAFEAVWTKNSANYGPHLAITSIGNIVGSKLCPNEKGEEVIGDWLPTWYKNSYVKPVDAMAKAFPRFGITSADQIETIFAYIQSKNTGEDEDAILKILTDAFAKAYPAKAKEVKDVDKIKKAAKQKEQQIKASGGHVTSSGSSGSSGSASSAGSSAGSASGSGSYNSSGSGADGQEDTILFILGGVMLTAAGAMVLSRRKKEE